MSVKGANTRLMSTMSLASPRLNTGVGLCGYESVAKWVSACQNNSLLHITLDIPVVQAAEYRCLLGVYFLQVALAEYNTPSPRFQNEAYCGGL